MHTTHRRQRGSILPFVALAMVLAGVCVVLLGRIGGAAAARAQARTAADAAALAGAAEGRSAAEALAQQNGAELLTYQDVGLDTLVRVRLGPAEADGRARRTGDRDGGPTTGPTAHLAPAMRAVLARLEPLLGQTVPVISGYRPADPPDPADPTGADGAAMHAAGLAVDVAPDFVARLVAVAAKAGLCHPYPAAAPTHFEVCQ